ncbi:MAG: sugar nucleotide-binding protein [Candidatus Micrarchaeota archaeon]|nr:sugar nucleotide-binding protein [Candidatus Micrarchaeota archaeon]
MRIRMLLLGASGVVGFHAASELRAHGHEVTTVSRNSPSVDFRADVTEPGELGRIVEKASPEVVINAIKPSMSVDDMEAGRSLAYEVNTLLPERLARLQMAMGFVLVHMSSDGVYEGKEGETYGEESIPYPQNFYTFTKALAEERVRCLAKRHLILRTEGVFGFDERHANFYMRMKDACLDRKEFPAAIDQFSQPIYGGELARLMRLLIEKGCNGTYNAVGPEYVSRFGLAHRLQGAMGWDCAVSQSFSAGRGMRMGRFLRVSTAKIEAAVGRIKSLESQIADLKRWENKNSD